MAKISETVNVMKQNFMALHNDGYTIPEIAQKYNLNNATVYRHLGEIAAENGVSRDDLLQVVRGPCSARGYREEAKQVRVDVKELRKGFIKKLNAIPQLKLILKPLMRAILQIFLKRCWKFKSVMK